MIAFLASMALSLILMPAAAMLATDLTVINMPLMAIIVIVLSLVNTILKPLTKVIGANLNPIALGIFMVIINVLVFIGVCLPGNLVALTGDHLWRMGLAAAAYSLIMYLLSFVLYRK